MSIGFHARILFALGVVAGGALLCDGRDMAAFAAAGVKAAPWLGEGHYPSENRIWRRQARLAAGVAERYGTRLGLEVSIIPAGAGGDERVAKAKLEHLRDTALGNRANGEASGKIAHMIEGARKAANAGSSEDEPGGSSEFAYLGSGRSACVIRLTAKSTSVQDALASAFSLKAVGELTVDASKSRIGAADLAFWVSAHESAHCLFGSARRMNLIDTAWSGRYKAPRSWGDSQSAGDLDDAVLARTEEIAADLMAAGWARQALGQQKAGRLIQLVQRGRRLGSRYDQDDLHDSSTALSDQALNDQANGRNLMFAVWSLARSDTLRVLGGGA